MKKTKPQHAKPSHQYPSLLRRLGAWFYDTLIVAAILMVAGALAMAIVAALLHIGILTLGDYQDASDYLISDPTASALYSAYLAIVIIGFYSYFWTQAGQTLGMRAWKLKLQNEDGSRIKITQAFIRIATSAFGLGNLLAFNNKRRSMQDIMAECEMVVTEKVS
ncbi:RDD family protein [Photobacterium kishitanii]|nr:RDD family protein [Photobacterium kishitanii]